MKSAISLLKQDHVLLKRLFRNFRKAKGHARSEIFRQIHEEIAAHVRVEDEILYPALEEIATDESEARYHEAREEHEEIRMLLDEMSGLDHDSRRFASDFVTLMQVLERHIELEEEGIFPLMRQYVSRTEFLEMGHVIEERKSAKI